ncbi:MAG: DoxX family protein [Microvirga sp.]
MAHFRRIVEDRAGPILLLGRLLLALLFVHEGLTLAGSLDAALSAMAKLGVAAPLALAAIALQIAAGTALAIGLGARFAAAALGVFCVATAVLFHTKFGIRNELLHFQKDLAIAGGMLILAACGAGAWSIDGLVAARRLAGNKARLPPVSDCTADLAEQG